MDTTVTEVVVSLCFFVRRFMLRRLVLCGALVTCQLRAGVHILLVFLDTSGWRPRYSQVASRGETTVSGVQSEMREDSALSIAV
jgi:hypothetical protein